MRRSSDARVDPAYLSVPRAVTFPTTGGQTAHAFYYPPANRDAQAPPGDLPPLLVKSHGGPTSATSPALTLGTQYWTSRGVAVLDVNYGGSTGYGREYRRRLEGQWGVVDVDDCVNGALALAARGEVDPRRLLISGGSAGGYTTLCALAFRDAFRAGGSYYGVSDLEALARDTHKFESRYLDRLIGPYPDRRDLYLARSPIHHLQGLTCPIIFFQGLEDAVVPPAQTETMVDALRQKGVPVAYLPFPGEQHGFRSAAQHRPRPGRGALLLRPRPGAPPAGGGRAGAHREPPRPLSARAHKPWAGRPSATAPVPPEEDVEAGAVAVAQGLAASHQPRRALRQGRRRRPFRHQQRRAPGGRRSVPPAPAPRPRPPAP